MITVKYYCCPYCHREQWLTEPLVYNTDADARKVNVRTVPWPYDAGPRVDGTHMEVQLRHGKKLLSRFLHACPALSF